MDSLTQIVLGASVGEVVLGKKLGNRAMLWGAIAGTIPDLDVIANVFMDEINALAFHRGITHSIFFAVVFSIIISRYTGWLYKSNFYRKKWYKILAATFGILFMIMAAFGLASIAGTMGNTTSKLVFGIVGTVIVILLTWRLWKNYVLEEHFDINLSWKNWYALFFWCFLTHSLLDCFTAFGTQLFAPFSTYRVSFDNISVLDPAYTFPFLICLIVSSFISRSSPKRRFWNWLGIGISSVYMLWTIWNKAIINQVLEDTLVTEKIAYDRYITNPRILNNVLWQATVESDSVFYQGLYSFFDKERKFKLKAIPKGHDMLDASTDDHTVNTLKWFCDNYYNIIRRKDGRFQLNDMRYGTRSGQTLEEDDFIFSFILKKDEKGLYRLAESSGGPERGGEKEMAKELWQRIKGI